MKYIYIGLEEQQEQNKKGDSIIIATERNLRKLREIEKMINKKIIRNEIPTGDMICEKQLLNLIKKVNQSSIDNQINKYLPTILKELEYLDKEELIKKFVSVEFNRFLSFYKNSNEFNKSTENNKKEELKKL